MKLTKLINLLLVFPCFFCLMGCVDDSKKMGESSDSIAFAVDRVIAKDYHVLEASREERQCRYQPARDAKALFSLEKGQMISLLSVKERGRRVNGDLWLHVHAKQQGACFVLASVLVPIGSHPVIK